MVKIGVAGSGEFMRRNQRSFVFSDTFKNLLKRTDCNPGSANVAVGSNYAYPISGKVGLEELIGTFIDLNEGFGLRADKASDLSKEDVTPVFADSLDFITTLTGSVSPAITLGPTMPVSHGLRLLDASLSGQGTRTDNHNVVVGLVMAPPPSAAKPPSKVAVSPLQASGFGKRHLR